MSARDQLDAGAWERMLGTTWLRVAGDPKAVHDRVDVTFGFESAGARVVHGLPYRAGAVVPRPGWRAATRAECAALTSDRPASKNIGTLIEVTRVPSLLLETLARLGLFGEKSIETANALASHERYARALSDALPPFLADLLEEQAGLRLLGTCVQHRGLWSTTTHTDPGARETFSGMHVDNWDKFPAAERDRARRQLCINLGAHDRYFVFAAVTVQELSAVIRNDMGYIGYAQTLAATGFAIPVYRVRVQPGEMYIAPTENLVHDGMTTNAVDCADITLNLRGRFRPVVRA